MIRMLLGTATLEVSLAENLFLSRKVLSLCWESKLKVGPTTGSSNSYRTTGQFSINHTTDFVIVTKRTLRISTRRMAHVGPPNSTNGHFVPTLPILTRRPSKNTMTKSSGKKWTEECGRLIECTWMGFCFAPNHLRT